MGMGQNQTMFPSKATHVRLCCLGRTFFFLSPFRDLLFTAPTSPGLPHGVLGPQGAPGDVALRGWQDHGAGIGVCVRAGGWRAGRAPLVPRGDMLGVCVCVFCGLVKKGKWNAGWI